MYVPLPPRRAWRCRRAPCRWENFDCKDPIAALKHKGFTVEHHFGTTPPVSQLDASLESASQVWLTSTFDTLLSRAHVDTIVAHWKKGLGVYIFGDNAPFFVDGNKLLAAMFPERVFASAGCPALRLAGDAPGGRTVTLRGGAAPGGFAPHLLTTGIERLFEGVTVSHLDPRAAALAGFEAIMHDHDGNLVVAARPAGTGTGAGTGAGADAGAGSEDEEGPVIVDGAFTKLFVDWNAGGSARFVRNCACWLSTNIESAAEAIEKDAAPIIADLSLPGLNYEGAFLGECSVTYEDGVPLALLATELSDPDLNTSDYALDNNLALGADNLVLCQQPIGIEYAKTFLQQGTDPFTRRPIACVIPLVALSDDNNLRIITEMANRLFMGGRGMSRHSLNILLSVCEEMLHNQPDSPGALRYLIGQLLQNAPCTVDMLKAAPGGPTVALVEGLTNNITATDEYVPYRKSVPHIGRIVRLLATNADGRTGTRLGTPTLLRVARRALLKTVVAAATKIAKGDGGEGGHLRALLDQLLFDTFHGIAIAGTSKVLGLPELAPMLEAGVGYVTPRRIEAECARTAAALCCYALVRPEDITALLVLLRGRGTSSWRVMVEPLLQELAATRPGFRTMWAQTTAEASVARPQQQAERQLTGHFATEPTSHGGLPWPGFVSCLGPSVYRCKCGLAFGDPERALTRSGAQALKERRNAHFAEVFAADALGYPTKTSVHFPLHRATQVVMTRAPFERSAVRTGAMEEAVAKYLARKAKGNIHVPTIAGDVRFAIDTYLACRARGGPEPTGSCQVDFYQRAQYERKLILARRSAGRGDWADPARES